MFVYIWKDTQNTPFYVGLTSSVRRTNPKNSPKRNWLCTRRLEEVGREHVVVELVFVDSIIEGQALERKLIELYGRIQLNNGPLTNLMSGGEGITPMSDENKNKLRESMRSPDHPIRSPAAVVKRNAAQKKRMNDPDVKAKFTGAANPAKRTDVRAKLKAAWADPAFKESQIKKRTGKTLNLSESERERRSKNVKENPLMKGWDERNGKDDEFNRKRIEGIRAAQEQRKKKMSDPVALAKRKAKLKETMNSPEYKAKRALWDTPEYRAKLAEAKRKYWADKKAV